MNNSGVNKSSSYFELFFVIFAIALGGIVRFYPAMLSDFPLNDGGMFYQMTMDLIENHFRLPLYTSYNGGMIPFSYPPLAFYLMAFLQQFFHIAIIDQLHYIPPLISTLTVPALYFLSKKITGSKEISTFAGFAYALMPHAYVWLIMGGGITRSFGILFGMLAIMFVWGMFQTPKPSKLILSILFCSLTILSHPEITWFVFLTALLIGLRYGLNKRGILYAGLTITGILILTSPWWISIIQRFGVSLFLNGFQSGGFINLSIFLFYFTGESFSDIIAVIALFGLLAEIARKRLFLFIWLIIISILTARSGQLLATIPTAMLFGSGIVWIFIPGLNSYKKIELMKNLTLDEIFHDRIIKVAFIIILVYSLISAMAVPFLGDTEIRYLSNYDRQAMEWVVKNTPQDSRFIILTGGAWHTDFVSEWFPALTKRISITTIQGSEWLADEQFQKNVDAYGSIQACDEDDFQCITNWADENGATYSHLYMRNSSPDEEKANFSGASSAVKSDEFQLVYENLEVEIYKVVGAP